MRERGEGLSPSPPPGLPENGAWPLPFGPALRTPSPQPSPSWCRPAYIAAGPSGPAGGQAFLLNFQELLGSGGEEGSLVICQYGDREPLTASPLAPHPVPEDSEGLQREKEAPTPVPAPNGTPPPGSWLWVTSDNWALCPDPGPAA